MQIRVGCEFLYEAEWPTPAVLQVQPRLDGAHRVVQETWQITPDLSFHEYHDIYDNICRRLTIPTGQTTLRYDALVEVPSHS